MVSVIIPTYDRPRRTRRAVDSVANQTYAPIELIVVDDGSIPPLEPSLDLPVEELHRAVLLRHDENRGANVARNTGLEAASGDYLAFLDSDDEWLPEKIERQVRCVEGGEGFEACYTGVRIVDGRGRVNSVRRPTKSGDLLDDLLREDVIGSYSLILVSRAAVDLAGMPDPVVPAWQDWEWYLRLAEVVEFEAVPDPLAVKHTGKDRLGRRYQLKRDGAYPILRERIRQLAGTRRQARIGVAHLNFKLGYTALVNGRYAEARRLFLAAIRGQPLEATFYLYLACAGRHYAWARDLKRAAVRLLESR